MLFVRERQKTFVVVVGVFITEQSFNRSILAAVCRRIVELLRLSKMLADLDGPEIIPSLISGGQLSG